MEPEYLTVAETAEKLNVSTEFVERLLTGGEAASRQEGDHLLVRADWVEQYKQQDDARRLQAADELTRYDQELGLY